MNDTAGNGSVYRYWLRNGPTVTGMTLPETMDLVAGELAPIVPQIEYSSNTPAEKQLSDVVWFSSNSNVAVVNSGFAPYGTKYDVAWNTGCVVSARGTGTCTLTAVSLENNEIMAQCKVTVSAATEVKSITLFDKDANTVTDQNITISMGGGAELFATISPSPLQRTGVTWESSDESIATVTENGIVWPKGAGTCTITATSKMTPSVSARCTVTVFPATIGGVSFLSESSIKTVMQKGQTATLRARASVTGGAENDYTPYDLLWSSSDANVIAVEFVSNGSHTYREATVTATGKGTCTITATSALDGSKYCSVAITVTAPTVSSVTLSPSTLTLDAGEAKTLTATVAPASDYSKNVTWSSSDPTVATVSENGTVVAVKPGSCTITAVSAEDGTKKGTCTVTVNEAPITLSQTTLKLTAGASATLTAALRELDYAGGAVVWASDDEMVAKVDETGKVTAVGAGYCTITATVTPPAGSPAVAAKSAVCSVEVTNPAAPPAGGGGAPDDEEADDEGGSATTVTTAPDGTVTATTTHEDGKQSVLVVKPGGDAAITVTDPDGKTMVQAALPAVIPETVRHFVDVKDRDWFRSDVYAAAGLGLFSGTSDTRFSPDTALDRGMLVTALHRMSGGTGYGAGAHAFSDVPANAYYANAADWANAVGVAYGTAKGFEPGASVTRQDMVVMLYRYAQLLGLDLSQRTKLDGFRDSAAVAGYAREALEWAVGAGIIGGRSNGALDPKGSATRAEVAAVLVRLTQFMKRIPTAE